MKNTNKFTQEKNQQLSQEEHEFIKTGSANYTKLKIALGELELQKQGLLEQAEMITNAFKENERRLIEKYGANAVINMQTGEVSQKEK
jgi:hypothetical protein